MARAALAVLLVLLSHAAVVSAAVGRTPEEGVPAETQAPGPMGVGRRIVNVPRSRLPLAPPGQPITAELVYPAAAKDVGIEQPWAEGKHPVVVWAPGWTCLAEQYASFTTRLASHGIASLLPLAWHGDAIPTFDQDAEDLLRLVDWLADGARTDPDVRGRVDTGAIGIAGHSSGGGTILEVMAQDASRLRGNRIAAGVTLGPAEFALADGRGTSVGGVSAGQVLGYITPDGGDNRKPGDGWRRIASRVRAPLLIVGGELDRKTRNRNNADIIFEEGRAAPKLEVILRRGSHCFLDYGSRVSKPPGDDSSPVSFGVDPWSTNRSQLWPLLFYGAGGDSECPESAIFAEVMHPDEQMHRARRMVTDFFALYLLRDLGAWPRVWGPELANDNGVVTVKRAPLSTMEFLGGDGEWTATPPDVRVDLASGVQGPSTKSDRIASITCRVRNLRDAFDAFDLALVVPLLPTLAVADGARLDVNVAELLSDGTTPAPADYRRRLDVAGRGAGAQLFRLDFVLVPDAAREVQEGAHAKASAHFGADAVARVHLGAVSRIDGGTVAHAAVPIVIR